jgi:hypothetical protein
MVRTWLWSAAQLTDKTTATLAEVLNRLNNLQQGDFISSHRQLYSTASATLRLQQASLATLLQQLAQVILWRASRSSNSSRADKLIGRLRGEPGKSSYDVYTGLTQH